MEKQTKPCRFCGSKDGWFEKRRHNGIQYFMPDGEPSHWADGNSFHGRRKFCANCNKDITKDIQP